MRLLKTILIVSSLSTILLANNVKTYNIIKIIDKNTSKVNQKVENQIIILNKKISSLKNENSLLKTALTKMIIDIYNLKRSTAILNNLYLVNTKVINVRYCPSIKCKVVRSRYKGDLVIVKDKIGHWYKTLEGNYIYETLLTKVK